MDMRCAPSCPPRQPFVASDARRRGQLCTILNRPDSTYNSGNAVQTTGAASHVTPMKIGHYLSNIVGEGGTIHYIDRLMAAQRAAGHSVIRLGLRNTARPHDAPEIVRVPDERQLTTIAREQGIDILHLHGPANLPAGSLLPAVRTVHGHSPHCPARSRYWPASDRSCSVRAAFWTCVRYHVAEKCERVRPGKILRNWRAFCAERDQLMTIPVICPSSYVYREMRRAGFPPERLAVVPHAHFGDRPPYAPPPKASDRIPFLFLGRLAPEKGLAWLLAALARTQGPIHLHVAGDGPERAAMVARAKALGISGRVTFHGWVDEQQRDLLLMQSRALIVPSTGPETFGLVVLEAFAVGRAVVAAATGALPEIVTHEKTGLHVEPGNAAMLAASLEGLAADYERAAALGRAGRAQLATRFSAQTHVAAVADVYARALSIDRAMESEARARSPREA